MEVIRTTDDTLADIAVGRGRSGPPHQTELVRRFVGESPARWRHRRRPCRGNSVASPWPPAVPHADFNWEPAKLRTIWNGRFNRYGVLAEVARKRQPIGLRQRGTRLTHRRGANSGRERSRQQGDEAHRIQKWPHRAHLSCRRSSKPVGTRYMGTTNAF